MDPAQGLAELIERIDQAVQGWVKRITSIPDVCHQKKILAGVKSFVNFDADLRTFGCKRSDKYHVCQAGEGNCLNL